MTNKIKKYLDTLFENVPPTQEVREAKDELYDGMMERYSDCVKGGMDEQEAYDTVIDSLGDIRELFDELNMDIAKDTQAGDTAGQSTAQNQKTTTETNQENTEQRADAGQKQQQNQAEPGPDSSQYHGGNWQDSFNLNDFLDGIANFSSGLVSGLLNTCTPLDLTLVNSQSVSLEGISNIDISYISESITVKYSATDQMVINEYMNRNDPFLYADISRNNGSVIVNNGRRTGQLFLRSYIEVFLPASWAGSLSLSTVSGTVKSEEEWHLSSLSAKTISGAVKFNTVYAPMIRLSSTSGPVALTKGVGTLDMHSISGSIKADSVEGSGVFKSTSGSVRVQFDELNGHVNSSTVSGGVRLGLPSDASFEINAKSVSGSIHTGFDGCLTFQKRNKAHGFVGSAPYYHIRIQTTSGGIHIND